jgi:hypothetical protein
MARQSKNDDRPTASRLDKKHHSTKLNSFEQMLRTRQEAREAVATSYKLGCG